MRARNTPKNRSGNTTPPPRDVDLLESDQFLPPPELDELWEWFYNAVSDSLDPELIFVKLINSARNPYRNHIPANYQPNTAQPDLLSLDHEDEVEQLKNLVNTLRSEVSSKDQVISSLEASNRESERYWAKELASKEKVVEKNESEDDVRRENEILQETVARQKEEIEALGKKREDLVTLLESLAKEQLHNGELYRESLKNKNLELERQQELASAQDERLHRTEEDLAAKVSELQERGNDYGKKLAEKDKELETKEADMEELRLVIESQNQILAQKLSECEIKHTESRRELIAAVCKGLSKKSLTPSAIGLQDDEWTNSPSTPTAPQRGWSWR